MNKTCTMYVYTIWMALEIQIDAVFDITETCTILSMRIGGTASVIYRYGIDARP